MKPSFILDKERDAIRAAVCRYHTANPRVFGSVLNGSDTDGSDLDLLVDVLTPGDLPPKFRAKVVAEARPL